jgi:L-cysteine S-thiosulfotransferase
MKAVAVGGVLAGVLGLAGCAATKDSGSGDADAGRKAVALMQKDFKTHGQATVERLKQDEVQALCTKYAGAKSLPADEARRVEASQLATVKYPADGRYLGDWKAGEKVAQAGVGKQWSDNPSQPSGGNCYACHQLSPQELSFGTIGPSLRGYGKLRGNTPEMQKYTFAKIYNAEGFNACSSMPRFGHQGILTEQQIKDVVALLMDPASPVNK